MDYIKEKLLSSDLLQFQSVSLFIISIKSIPGLYKKGMFLAASSKHTPPPENPFILSDYHIYFTRI